jgi:hypothetical protein
VIYFPFHTQKICESHLNHSSDSSQVLLKKQCISVWNHQPESILSINKSDRTKIQRRFIANMTPKVSRGSSNCTHWFKGTWITTVESKSKYVYCLLFTTRKKYTCFERQTAMIGTVVWMVGKPQPRVTLSAWGSLLSWWIHMLESSPTWLGHHWGKYW